MVSTRNHPREFPPPTSPRSNVSSPTPTTSTSPSPPTPTPSRNSATTWTHTPSNFTLIWLAISLPLVIWDTLYMFLRPWSMPGGFLHSPIWKPYALQGQIDYIYGWPAWEAKDGFSAAQAALNAVETTVYAVYLWIVYEYGVELATGNGRGAPRPQALSGGFKRLSRPRRVSGKKAGWAVLLMFAAAVMTVSKTVLYWLQEYFGGFPNIGHNDPYTLFFLWIIPNGAWIVFPSYLIYVFGQEILEGLAIASGERRKRS